MMVRIVLYTEILSCGHSALPCNVKHFGGTPALLFGVLRLKVDAVHCAGCMGTADREWWTWQNVALQYAKLDLDGTHSCWEMTRSMMPIL